MDRIFLEFLYIWKQPFFKYWYLKDRFAWCETCGLHFLFLNFLKMLLHSCLPMWCSWEVWYHPVFLGVLIWSCLEGLGISLCLWSLVLLGYVSEFIVWVCFPRYTMGPFQDVDLFSLTSGKLFCIVTSNTGSKNLLLLCFSSLETPSYICIDRLCLPSISVSFSLPPFNSFLFFWLSYCLSSVTLLAFHLILFSHGHFIIFFFFHFCSGFVFLQFLSLVWPITVAFFLLPLFLILFRLSFSFFPFCSSFLYISELLFEHI